MSSPPFEIGLAGPGDEPALLDLVNLVQPHVPWDAAHLRWQCDEPPAGPARRYVARDGDRIMSLYIVVAHPAHLGSAGRRLWMVQDVMTHPDARGQGLLHALGRRALDDLLATGDGAHTFPNASSRRSFERLGWTDRGPVPAMRHALHPAPPDVGPPPALRPAAAPADLPADAWARADLGDGVERSPAYLAWRYRRPRTRYGFEVIDDGAGYLITKWYRHEAGARLHVCDLAVDAARRDLVAPVLAEVCARAIADGADDVTAWCPHDHPYRAAHEAAGFVADEDPERRVYTTGAGPGPTWHLSLGDSDVY